MADPQSNARLRAHAGTADNAGTPTSGVIHVRTRLTADFTVISNALAQRRGSAVTVGVAAYILSLPDGSPVSIAALCAHFTEGEILISRALRDLEAAGYLERRRERTTGGRIRTRTYFHDVPDGTSDGPDGPPEPPRPTRREATTGSARKEGDPPPPLADADPEAVAVLAALRRVDPRLTLSGTETARLAPAVAQWLAAGVPPAQITEQLTARLPDRFLARPARILAFRLRDTPLAVPAGRVAQSAHGPSVLPFQTCDGCERAFRAAAPGHCRACLTGERLRQAC